MIKLLDLNWQYRSIRQEIDDAIHAVIEESGFIGGKHVREFEQAFASFVGTKHCVGVANGTDALEIAIEALELPPQSEIIVPGNSFIASAEAVTRAGHRVVFCDCNETDYCLEPKDVARRITRRTKAIVAVHLYGHPADMAAIDELAHAHGLQVIEDCAQAHGAEFRGRQVGTMGRIAAFSFYPGKNLGAYGDAGAIVTNDDALALRCRMIGNHGRVAKYNHEFEGRNSRLDGIQAAILAVKLRHLKDWTSRRIEVARYYFQRLEGCSGMVLPKVRPGARHVFHLFVIRTERRDALQGYLEAEGVQTGIHYPISLPKLKAYASHGMADEAMRVNQYDGEVLSLPMGEHLSDREVELVASVILEFFRDRSVE